MTTRGLAVTVAGLVTVSLAALVSPVAAGPESSKRVQFGVMLTSPTGDLVQAGSTTELDEAFGFQVSFDVRVSDLVSIEPAISSSSHDVTVESPPSPNEEFEIDATIVAANVNFHLLRDSEKVDFFLGPTLGYTFWGDLETDLQDFPVDDEFVYGLNLGLDVPIGERSWSFTGGLTYLLSEFNLEGSPSEIGVDPIQLRVGLSYRF